MTSWDEHSAQAFFGHLHKTLGQIEAQGYRGERIRELARRALEAELSIEEPERTAVYALSKVLTEQVGLLIEGLGLSGDVPEALVTDGVFVLTHRASQIVAALGSDETAQSIASAGLEDAKAWEAQEEPRDDRALYKRLFSDEEAGFPIDRSRFLVAWARLLLRSKVELQNLRRPDVKIPMALTYGEDAPLRAFGRKSIAKRQKQLSLLRDQPDNITFSVGKSTISIPVQRASGQMITAIQKPLDHRVYRGLMACLGFMVEDDTDPFGTFEYHPWRLCDALYARNVRKNGTSFHKAERAKEADSIVEALMEIRITREYKRADGEQVDAFESPLLVQMERPVQSEPRKGRSKPRLLQFGFVFLDMMKSWFIQLDPESLKTPQGVRPELWDSALAVGVQLSCRARATRPKEAKHPWTLTEDYLIEAANIMPESAKPGRVKKRLRELIKLWQTHTKELGEVRFSQGRVHFDVLRYREQHPSNR